MKFLSVYLLDLYTVKQRPMLIDRSEAYIFVYFKNAMLILSIISDTTHILQDARYMSLYQK